LIIMPPTNLRARNIAGVLEGKIRRGQARRFVVQMDDTPVTIEDLRKQLTDWKVEGLEEIIIVKDGKIIPFYPFER
jgi:uncharacterized membrane protein